MPSEVFMMPVILEGGAIASAAITTLQTNPVAGCCCVVVLSVMAVDKTNDIANSIEIGILEGTREIPVASQAGTIAKGTGFSIRTPCVLREGQRIYAKFDIPSSGDELFVVAHGFLRPYCL